MPSDARDQDGARRVARLRSHPRDRVPELDMDGGQRRDQHAHDAHRPLPRHRHPAEGSASRRCRDQARGRRFHRSRRHYSPKVIVGTGSGRGGERRYEKRPGDDPRSGQSQAPRGEMRRPARRPGQLQGIPQEAQAVQTVADRMNAGMLKRSLSPPSLREDEAGVRGLSPAARLSR